MSIKDRIYPTISAVRNERQDRVSIVPHACNIETIQLQLLWWDPNQSQGLTTSHFIGDLKVAHKLPQQKLMRI